jgi:plasmid replication initiation protein
MANQKEDQLVRYFKQSNSIIEAKYKLKYVEKCVFAKAYMMVEEKDLDDPQRTYRIYIKDLIKDFGLSNDGMTYKNVRDWARELRKKELTFPYVDENGQVKTVYSGFFTSVIASNEIDETNRDAYIEVEFDRRLKPYLIVAKKYTLFNQKRYEYICSKLHNATIIRLYEILKQYYRHNAEHSEKWFNLEELKEILGVSENYSLYGSFKQKVLLLAQERFAQYADIRFDFIEKKQGKAISEIKFSIHLSVPEKAPEWMREEIEKEILSNKEKKGKTEVRKDIIPSAILVDSAADKDVIFTTYLVKAQSIGISEAVLRLVIETHDVSSVVHGLEYTLYEAQKGKIKDSIDGYFISAVKGKYTNAAFEKDRKKRVGEGQATKADNPKTMLKKQIELLQDDIFAKQNDIIKDLISKDETITSRAIEQSVSTVKNTPQLNAYVEKKGWDLANLDINTWRKDKLLRECVIAAIISEHKDHFAILTPQYEQLRTLQQRFAAGY